MINLNRVKSVYEAVRAHLDLSAPEGSFDYMMNFHGNQGTKIMQLVDGCVTIIAYEADRGTHSVEFQTSNENELLKYLIDRLIRSCAVRDMMNDGKYEISSGYYLKEFEKARNYYFESLSNAGLLQRKLQ